MKALFMVIYLLVAIYALLYYVARKSGRGFKHAWKVYKYIVILPISLLFLLGIFVLLIIA